MSLVLDGSTTVAWLIPDEHTAAPQRVLEQVGTRGAVVPTLWRLEVGNALTLAVRRKRMSRDQRADALAKLSGLPIEADAEAFKSDVQNAGFSQVVVLEPGGTHTVK